MAPPRATGRADARTTPHGRALAGPGSRILARLIDGVIVGLLSWPVFVWGFEIDLENADFVMVESSAPFLLAALGAAYEIGLVAMRSATIGKMAMKIEIVRKADGHSPVGFGTATLRWAPNGVGYVVNNLSTLFALASLVLVFADSMRRSVYDFAAQTYVVQKY